MSYKKILLPVALSFLLIGAGCSLTQTVERNTNVQTTNSNAAAIANICEPSDRCVSYAGQDGKNALELLQADHHVDASDEGFVNAIDGVKPGEKEFWAFYVNGEQAQVGAKDYQTKNSDHVEWTLEGF